MKRAGQSVNIPDVYTYDGFDFSGPRNYDQMTGFRTRSMLVVPMENHEGEITGVLQLINSLEEDKKTVRAFPIYFQKVVESLASQAAIALSNAKLIKDIESLFNSFVEEQHVVVTARMLEKILFIKKFKDVPRFASMHNSAPIWPAQLFPSTYFQTGL